MIYVLKYITIMVFINDKWKSNIDLNMKYVIHMFQSLYSQ